MINPYKNDGSTVKHLSMGRLSRGKNIYALIGLSAYPVNFHWFKKWTKDIFKKYGKKVRYMYDINGKKWFSNI